MKSLQPSPICSALLRRHVARPAGEAVRDAVAVLVRDHGRVEIAVAVRFAAERRRIGDVERHVQAGGVRLQRVAVDLADHHRRDVDRDRLPPSERALAERVVDDDHACRARRSAFFAFAAKLQLPRSTRAILPSGTWKLAAVPVGAVAVVDDRDVAGDRPTSVTLAELPALGRDYVPAIAGAR